jgi:hypothetical protein
MRSHLEELVESLRVPNELNLSYGIRDEARQLRAYVGDASGVVYHDKTGVFLRSQEWLEVSDDVVYGTSFQDHGWLGVVLPEDGRWSGPNRLEVAVSSEMVVRARFRSRGDGVRAYDDVVADICGGDVRGDHIRAYKALRRARGVAERVIKE